MPRGLNTSNVYIMNAQPGETIPLAVTSTTGNVAFALPASIANSDVMITNAGAKLAFVNFGIGSGTVATVPGTSGTLKSTPILAGAIYTLQKNSSATAGADTCAAICAGSDTTTLYFTSIQGS